MRTMYVLLAVLSASLGLLLGVGINLLMPPRVSPTPVEWVQTDYVPQSVCPGDLIEYDLILEIDQPGGLYVYPTYRRAADHPDIVAIRESDGGAALMQEHDAFIVGDTAVGGRNGDVFITGFDEHDFVDDAGRPVDRILLYDLDVMFFVPDSLQPGPYSRLLIAGMYGVSSRPATRVQPFTVLPPEECANGD